MSKAKQVLGKDLMLFVGGEAIALATSCKIGVSAETIDTQSKDSGMWGEKGVKKLGWNCSSENCFSADADINGYDRLFAAFVAAEPVDIAFGIPSNKSNTLPSIGWALPPSPYTGKAIITSLELNAPDGDKATFSVSLDGTGSLQQGNSSALPSAHISAVIIGGFNLTNEIDHIDFGSYTEPMPLIIKGGQLGDIGTFLVQYQTDGTLDVLDAAVTISKRTNTEITSTIGKDELGSYSSGWILIKGDGKTLFEWGKKEVE